MRASAIAVALVLTGCDVVYGLSGRDAAPIDAVATVDADPCPNDRDCDFVLDPIDNCLDVPNSDQDDFDNDDIGDRCDPCSAILSPLADEDGDTKPDSMDNCPTVFATDQLDADGDGVGDVCDPNQGADDDIACFFSFSDVDETSRMWAVAAPWSVTASRLAHNPGGAMPTAISLVPVGGMLTAHDAFELRTSIQFAPLASVPIQLGIGISEPGLADLGVRCVVVGFQGARNLSLLDANDQVLAQAELAPFTSAQQEMTFRFRRQGPTTMLGCSVRESDGSGFSEITGNGPPLAAVPTVHLISANANTAFLALTTYRLGP